MDAACVYEGDRNGQPVDGRIQQTAASASAASEWSQPCQCPGHDVNIFGIPTPAYEGVFLTLFPLLVFGLYNGDSDCVHLDRFVE